MRTATLPTGPGCTYLDDDALDRMAARGFDPSELAGLDYLERTLRNGIGTLLERGLPRYWVDEGVILVHPSEVLIWLICKRDGGEVAR